MSWQEQYDMGIRLLAEGNYEEAILVFQAMIQIDPRQSEVYQKLAEAYIAVGDYEKAASVLAEGFKTTGVASLEQQLKDVQAQIDALAAQTGSPAEEPEIPEALRMEGSHLSYYGKYVIFTEDMYAMFEPMISAGLQGDKETLRAVVEKLDRNALAQFSYEWDRSEKHYIEGYTVWNGALLGYRYTTEGEEWHWLMEYRPADGMGLCFVNSYQFDEYKNWYTEAIRIVQGPMDHWLFHGEFIDLTENYTPEDVYQIRCTGTANEERLHGEYMRQEHHFERDYMIKYHYVYEDGIAQEAWTDPDTGEKCTVYRLVVKENGEVSEQYHFFDESVYKENVRYVYDGPNMY
ncbi:MAG: tetratricopeptide repeat protein [Lachnospiraceae bacterium]|nr:tetratricopeptide repeat protein [Lachnospiraceae bacterium]